MSYALETSKRKFHRLLDTITSTPSASQASEHARNAPASAGAIQPSTKRARLNATPNVTHLLTTNNTNLSTPSLRSIRAVTSGLRTQTKSSPYKTLGGDEVHPHAPSSRHDFLLRLKTFSFHGIVNWHLKPEAISEVRWAKHGWVLQGKETVRCTNCHKQIIVEYNEGEPLEASDHEDLDVEEQEKILRENAKALADKYVALMSEGHDEQCLWRQRPCDDTIYRLPVNTPSVAAPALKERYESVLKMHDKLPRIHGPEGVDLAEVFNKFIARMYTGEKPAPSIEPSEGGILSERVAKQTAFAFALLGWYAATSDQLKDGMVTCGACFRRLGFWMWPPGGQADDETDGDALLCDIVEEHRPYCPWQNGEVQNAGAAQYNYASETLAGWECLVRLVKTHDRFARDERSASPRVMLADVSAEERPASADANGTDGEDLLSVASREEVDSEHKERLGRWQRLKTSLTLHKSKKV